MKPPYHITATSLRLVSSISVKIGELNANLLVKTNPKLRKQNKIRTIHSSLAIEGNTLSLEQITAIVENKRVIGPEKDIREVLNALSVYNKIGTFNSCSEKDFLKAHRLLMAGLIEGAGTYRCKNVGIAKGAKIEHLAPPHKHVNALMKDLFRYLKTNHELSLIKSCVFHYEMEFIHPFMDGNGRMGRLWQTVILMNEYPLFEYLPFETLISKHQKAYYTALSRSDKEGKSTHFIEFMLKTIDSSLSELLQSPRSKLREEDRLSLFLESQKGNFTRKDYLTHYSELSTATASRDLRYGVANHLIKKIGDKKTSTYVKK